MAELVADFLCDAAMDIILPERHDEREDDRICLCCKRGSRLIDDDGCESAMNA
jgi:hypothetical protein